MVVGATTNAPDVGKWLREAARQLPFAASVALNETGRAINADLAEAARDHFDRPTPFTLRAFGLKRSTKRNLTALVFIKQAQAEYLRYQVFGGTQRRAGNIPVPLRRRPNLKLNQYGNLPRRSISRLLARPDTFVGTVKGVFGIYRRGRRSRRNPNPGVKLLVAFETETQYRPRFPYFAIVRRSFHHHWPDQFDQAYDKALRTARPRRGGRR